MDPVTHALASYTLKRAAFPRLARPATVAMVLAGTLADVDMLSRSFGPSAYLAWNRTFFHSVLAALLLGLLAALPFLFIKTVAPENRARALSVFVPAVASALLHVLLDLCDFQGVVLGWPVSSRRFALDWLPTFNLSIPGLLLAALFLPKLASLVSEEIGARSKGPRGRGAAIATLVLLAAYVGARGLLHANAVATLDARTYGGESARRVAAIPTSWPLTWTGVVETERALREPIVSTAPGSVFDPELARASYKPDPSPALDAALKTVTARRFIAATRFPKASLEKTQDGYRISIRAFPYDADLEYGRRVQAIIDVDAAGKILSETLAWDPASHQP